MGEGVREVVRVGLRVEPGEGVWEGVAEGDGGVEGVVEGEGVPEAVVDTVGDTEGLKSAAASKVRRRMAPEP